MSDFVQKLTAALAIALSMLTCAQAVTTSYHIGNSLTYDSQPLGIEHLAASRGLDHEVGFHILTGAPLGGILENPEMVSVDPNEYGTFSTALPNNQWDIVTIQPHSPSTLGEDVQSVISLINLTQSNPANANTNFYIYQSWPQLGSASYQARWLASSPDNPSTAMTRSREYFNNLIERVRDETDANVYMIPVGEVLYELDVRMRAGQIPGYNSITSFYRDALHMGFSTGRFVAGATTFSTILGQYPTELENDDGGGHYGVSSSLTTAQREAVLETIRDVLDKHSYSGVKMPPPFRADFDGNVKVDEIDLQYLLPSLNVEDPYDFDLDGDVDGRDFLNWQRNFQPVLPDLSHSPIDLDHDGIYTPADIQVWQNSYGIGDGADVDGDGDTDGRDFLLWQRAAPYNPADYDFNQLVNGFELNLWQQSYGYHAIADANGDGHVDMADYEIWEEESGREWTFPYALSAPPLASQSLIAAQSAVVPEPNTLFIAAALLVCPLAIRRKAA